MLQLMRNKDSVYITMEQNEQTTANELMEILRKRKERIIIIDEYTLVKNRKESERNGYLYTLASNGKRVIITRYKTIKISFSKI